MSSKLLLVLSREFSVRVRKRSFWIMTFLFPLIMIGVILVPSLIVGQEGKDEQRVAIIDATGKYAPLFANAVGSYQFERSTETLEALRRAGEDDGITAVLSITGDLEKDPTAIQLYSFKQLPVGLQTYIDETLSSYLTQQRIASYNIPGLQEAFRDSQVELHTQAFVWNGEGEATESSGEVTLLVGMMLSLLSYFFVSVYGGMIVQSVMEEKKNRIVEVIVSSVRLEDLMMGKVLGVGLVGLFQLALWIVLLLAGVTIGGYFLLGDNSQLLSGEVDSILTMLQGMDFVSIICYFVLYFIGGYLFYGSILAALGALGSSDEESSQMLIPVILIQMVSMYIGMSVVQNPDGALGFWTSIIPFTSPVVMMSRVPYGVPLWQGALSLVLLYLSFYGMGILGARVYRIGVLMQGKRPNVREILHWIRRA